MSKESALHVLNHLALVVQCPPFTFNAVNSIELTVEDTFGVIIHYAEDLNALISNVVICPMEEKDMVMLYEVLCGNYMWVFSAGGNLSIDRETGLLCLQYMHKIAEESMEDDAIAYEKVFAQMIGAARYWLGRIEESRNADGFASDSAHSASDGIIDHTALRI